MNVSTKKITTLSLLTAMSIVLTLMIRFPLVPAVPFLSFDAKDVIIAIGGFIYGPLAAAVVSVLVSVLEIFFRGGTIIDVIMNVVSTCTFVCVAAYIYKKDHTLKGAIVGLVSGLVCSTLSMIVWNYVMDPIYFHMPREAVVAMLPAITLFNVLKCGVNGAIVMMIYKPIVRALRSSGLVQESKGVHPFSKPMFITGLFLLVTLVLFILGFNGII